MKVYKNGDLVESLQTIDQLQEFLEDLRIDCKKSNKVLTILIDGRSVEDLYPGLNETDIGQVEIEMQSPENLVVEGLISSLEYLPKLIQGLNQVISDLRESRLGEGISLFEQSLEGISWMNYILTGLDEYILPLEMLKGDHDKYNRDLEWFADNLKELLMALENDDYVLISDLLEYELVPNLEKWQRHIPDILDKLAGV